MQALTPTSNGIAIDTSNHATASIHNTNKLFMLMVILLAMIIIPACDSPGTKPGIADAMPEDEAEQQLWLAKQALPNDKAIYLLRALDIYLARDDLENSQKAVNLLQSSSLTTSQYEQFTLLAGPLAMRQNDPETVVSYFDKAPLDAFSSVPLDIQLQASELQAEALLRAGRPLQAARIRVFNAGLYTGDSFWENQDNIWRALREAPSLGISKALEDATDYSWRGWLELIEQIRQNQFSLEMQINALQQWQARWPEHSAAQRFPAELNMLGNLPELRPNKIALMLPLSGKLAKVGGAIRDGFLAAYYRDDSTSKASTVINIFDADAYPNALDLYMQLQTEGYDLIIGPLRKSSVAELTKLPRHEPLTLALNYQDELTEAIPGLFQFGLSAEDEVQQILNMLLNQKNHNIAAIYPDAAWARKLVKFMHNRITEEDLPPVLSYQYSKEGNLSDGIANLLGINESKARALAIERLTGRAKFEPRRRQDIDAVILLASPAKARQIKPLLAFHYARDIPVYASSRVYSGVVRPDKDHDLDGIHYTEIPWLLSHSSPIRKDIHYLAGENSYEKFYAMGTDTYLLAPRLQLMESFPESKAQGFTGNLGINSKLQIRRELEWATFDRGVVKAQPGYQR